MLPASQTLKAFLDSTFFALNPQSNQIDELATCPSCLVYVTTSAQLFQVLALRLRMIDFQAGILSESDLAVLICTCND